MTLTQSEHNELLEYKEKFKKMCLDTGRANRQEVESAFENFYKQKFKFHWVKSPYEGINLILENSNLNEKQIREKMNHGSFDTYQIAYHCFKHEVLNMKKNLALDFRITLIKNVGPFWIFNDSVVISEKPVRIDLDGPVIEWSDNCVSK